MIGLRGTTCVGTSLKELKWVRRVLRKVFVSPCANGSLGVAAISLEFAPLTVYCPSCRPYPLFQQDTLRQALSRLPESSSGPGEIPALHLFRRSFAVGRARFPFQMSSSLERSRHSSRSPFTDVARCSLLSHSSSISPPIAVRCYYC